MIHLLYYFFTYISTVNLETPILLVMCFIAWFYIGGIFITATAFHHSDINLGVYYAKQDGKNTFNLRILQCICCLIYIAYFVGYYVVYKLVI